ncbi:hypothetical protein AB2N04_10465 [Nitratireductor sp. GISD-1A_MAKvit]|uniref:hypothetical protein n=1 Tax=Nitratireductor sp. GISD-1A_MAKvit TaxID=3234198 RepID=UPI0034679732
MSTVKVVSEALFDCSALLGKVFDDKNQNGYQDDGEPGIPSARVASAKGLLITSDAQGRFHVPCADLPDSRIGTNYALKLDTRSLPSGYRLTTENPRVVRLTKGKASKFSFGAAIGRVVRLDLADHAFIPGQKELRSEWLAQIENLIALLEKEPSVLRLSYAGSSRRLGQQRLKAIRRTIENEWRRAGGRYRLEIEARVQLVGNRPRKVRFE